ncbi:MAG: TonB family protein [Hyphomicrobiaceae bacterium]
MNLIRATAVAISALVHASLGYSFAQHEPSPTVVSFEKGEGEDVLTVEQGIAIEGLAKLGNDMETIETAEVTPVDPVTPPPPIEEVKPVDELSEAITSEQSKVEDNIVKLDEPPPPEAQQEKPPEQVQPVQQPQQVAILSEQSSGEAKVAGDATARMEYLGKLRNVLERAKVNPRSRQAGTVVVKFKIGTDGQLMSREITTSSGSKVLDDAALAALDRAAPFPSMPAEVADEPLVVSVPFKFITR